MAILNPAYPGIQQQNSVVSDWAGVYPLIHIKRAGANTIKAVGGSSTINGQFFDRGASRDYDAWKAAGSPEFDDLAENTWDWEGILPFFKKVTRILNKTPRGLTRLRVIITEREFHRTHCF